MKQNVPCVLCASICREEGFRQPAGRRHSWLREWPAQRLSVFCRGKVAEKGLEGTVPQRPGVQLEKQQDGG